MPHHHAYWYNHGNRMFMCGPSRLVWFGIGSVATWAWIHHRHNRDRDHDHQHGGGLWGYRRRVDCRGREDAPEYQPPLSREWPPSMRPGPRLDAQAQAAPAAPSGAGAGSASVGGPSQREPVAPALADQDLERLRQFGRNAEETISGMSEATIDSMMGALQGLKDRLADRRDQQQLQEIRTQQTTSTPPPEESPPRRWV
ncbi:hypothetical protein BC826DRAFT_1019705 [Russula brevipes]|nr:hypothetical protein BC826DRAFT_1019705 [Russula brevipes]